VVSSIPLPWNDDLLSAFSVVWGSSTGTGPEATSVVWGSAELLPSAAEDGGPILTCPNKACK
jgi:hypothetical protein